MMTSAFDVMVLIVMVFITLTVVTTIVASIGKAAKNSSVNTISNDGHIVPKNQDLTCEQQYGHNHSSTVSEERRYIVHEDPEKGYVILNGVKRRIEDCKYL